MRRRGWAGLWAGGAVALALAGCGHHGAEEDEVIGGGGGAAKQVASVPVTVAELRRAPVERSVPIEGTLRPWE